MGWIKDAALAITPTNISDAWRQAGVCHALSSDFVEEILARSDGGPIAGVGL